MSAAAHDAVSVLIHPSQFPATVEASLRASLRTREMNHKFHYDTPKQALRWLRLHEALSPARTDPDCGRIYEAAFAECAARLAGAREVEVLSLGCGGGQKDAQLLRCLKATLPDVRLRYVPVDVSVALALVARAAAIAAGVAPEDTVPSVVDLAEAGDWASALAPALRDGGRRIVCFFGMLPNFIPRIVLPQLAALLRPAEVLLLSANLAPGADYASGVARVLPLYENALTSEWLWTVLTDLGLARSAGEMTFSIAPCPHGSGLLRIESCLRFGRACRIEYAGEEFNFALGETFRLFFSYRHTPARLAALLQPLAVVVRAEWSNASGEEGAFLCTRN